MKLGIIDADLLYSSRQSFPNLASMKISGFYNSKGWQTKLILDYQEIAEFDRVYISKVFTDTYVPDEVLYKENVFYGGTGFFYDRAPALPEEVEHHMPDYDLYRKFVEKRMERGEKPGACKFYMDYSIGFLTRGCFRKCAFCVNKNFDKSVPASPIREFMDKSKKKLCFLDDNFFACQSWEMLLESVLETEKPFQFRQGLDIRILQKRQMEKLFKGKLDGNVIFAFDDIKDKEIIRRKLDILYETVTLSKKELKFYVLCGFDWNMSWRPDFWLNDLKSTMERIKFLMQYGCLPYVMRYEKWKEAPRPYRGMYITLSRWCNQPAQFKKKSLYEFSLSQGEDSAAFRYYHEFVQKHPEFAGYLNMKYEEVRQYGKIHG